jgi:hypothetical protein
VKWLVRRLPGACRAAALGACGAACALWLVSLSASHLVTWHRPHPGGVGYTILTATSAGGSLELEHVRDPVGVLVRPGLRHRNGRPRRGVFGDLWWAFRLVDGTEVKWVVEVPYWAVALVTGALPLARWASRRRERLIRERRQSRGLCPACGYDLRGSPGQCPECGAQPPA